MTTSKDQHATVDVPDVCDSRLLPAYDSGIDDSELQSQVMRELGDIMEDHLCDAKEEPDVFPEGCSYGCFQQR